MIVLCVFCAWMSSVLSGTDSATPNGTDNNPIVTTTYGTLRGLQYTRNQVNLMKFLGIPYAEPPVGQWRFKAPQLPSNWSGVRDATSLGNECPQTSLPLYTPVTGIPQTEDCLFLNVYAPTMNNTATSQPVMVWVHGGGYAFGGGSQYDGSDLAAKGVVVVTFNYRLGALGFLSTETDEMPGNYGMLDQIQALRWVQENIATFGGDPDQVTIFGESAGSVSVSLLMLSPLSKGLFKRAIMESGVSLTAWGIKHPASRISSSMFTRLVGDAVGCSDFEPSMLLACLQNVDAIALHNASEGISNTLQLGLMLQPRVENTFGFLPDLPIRLLSRGEFHHVDSLRGFNAEESGSNVLDSNNEGYTLDSFKDIVNRLFFKVYAITDADQLIQEIVDMYVGNATDPFVIRAKAIQAMTDLDYKGSTLNEIDLVLKSDPVNKHYLYQFSYRPSYSLTAPWQGTVHADELPFVFGITNEMFDNFWVTANTADESVSCQILTMWTNFAKTGDPTSLVPSGAETWLTYSSDKQQYLDIDITSTIHSYNRPEVTNLYYRIIQKLDTGLDQSSVVVG